MKTSTRIVSSCAISRSAGGPPASFRSGDPRAGRRRCLLSAFDVCFLPVLGALVMLTGCETPGPRFDAQAATRAGLAALTNFTAVPAAHAADVDLLRPPAASYTLGPGDHLQIEILGDPTTRSETTVGPDGKIYFYFLPGLEVWGLTLPEVKARLEQSLLEYMRKKPKVGVTLLAADSQRVWLLGRLSRPGVYPLTGPTTLLAALAEAGGTTSPAMLASLSTGPMLPSLSQDVADLHRSFVMRHGKVLPVDFYRLLKDGDMSQNIYLRPDDFVYVPSATARQVFVLGAVFAPAAVPYRLRLSLVAAIAGAQGTIKDAYLSHVAVVRGSLTRPRIAVVDYKAVLRGETPDVLLEPGDIVYVPRTPYHVLTRYVNLILRTFVQTVAINEGARAVSRNVVPVGVSIGGGAAQ